MIEQIRLFRGTFEVGLLLCLGVYFTLRLSSTFCRAPLKFWQALKGNFGKSGSFRALSLALAGTLGVGNIAGVAAAIAAGGAGAVFWMWVAAFLAMPLKYAEIVLALSTRVPTERETGALSYIKRALGKKATVVFAFLTLLCALTLGGILQSFAAAKTASVAFHMEPFLYGICFALLLFLVWYGKSDAPKRFCAALVPFICLLFLSCSAAVLISRRHLIGAAFRSIFEEAFSFSSAGGGLLGVLTAKSVQNGVSRGLVSNEAGCGTSPTAHGEAQVRFPAEQGVWGMVEVFVDTVLLCTVTALVILVSGVDVAEKEGMALAMEAYRATLGEFAAPFLAISVTAFAFATVLCWSHYGNLAFSYLFPKKQSSHAFFAVMTATVFLGTVLKPTAVWDLTDWVLFLMVLLNGISLFRERKQIVFETLRYFRARGCGKSRGD